MTDDVASKAGTGIVSAPPVPSTEGAPTSFSVSSMPSRRIISEALLADEKSSELTQWRDRLTSALPLAAGPNPALIEAALLAEFPWMEAPVRAITKDLRLRQSAGKQVAKWRPLLIVGPSGNGKSRLAKRLAALIGAGFGEVPAAGSMDNRLLAGSARTWKDASPGLVLHVIRRCGFANPTMLVDEIDKTRPDGRCGDIRDTLLGLLEPLTAAQWIDEYLMVPCDLSAVNWLLAANSTRSLPGPLLSRLHVVTTSAPTPEHFPTVLAAIRHEVAADLEIREEDLAPFDLPWKFHPAVSRAFGEVTPCGVV